MLPGMMAVAGLFGATSGRNQVVAIAAQNPNSLFYDVSSPLSAYVERSNPTTPATVGDPVGTLLDLSGNGNHAVATSDDSRPTLRFESSANRHYLEFDGVDDRLDYDGSIYVQDTFSAILNYSMRADGRKYILSGSEAGGLTNFHCGWEGTSNHKFALWGNDLDLTLSNDNAKAVYSYILNGSGKVMRKNGLQVGSNSQASQLTSNVGANIGFFPFFGAVYADANFYGYFGYKGNLVSSDRDVVEQFFLA